MLKVDWFQPLFADLGYNSFINRIMQPKLLDITNTYLECKNFQQYQSKAGKVSALSKQIFLSHEKNFFLLKAGACTGLQIRVHNYYSFSYFLTKTYVVGTQKKVLIITISCSKCLDI